MQVGLSLTLLTWSDTDPARDRCATDPSYNIPRMDALQISTARILTCLLYTSDAADDC